MRIIFMGTPEIARICLARLCEDGREIVGVCTKRDTQNKRGMKLTFSEVKAYALAQNLPVYQPETFRDEAAMEWLRSMRPDLIAVVAYGKLLPQAVLDISPLGCVNIHGSILPALRGAAPIQRAVLGGLQESGVTAMYMAKALDAGDIIDTVRTQIGPDETSGELMLRMASLSADLLSRTVDGIEAGTAARTPQDDAAATYAPMLTREEAPVDWTKPARAIHDQVRGLNPWPVAETVLGGARLRIYRTKVLGETTSLPPGTPAAVTKAGLKMACGDGTVLLVVRVQASGGRQMNAADYFRGHPLERP